MKRTEDSVRTKKSSSAARIVVAIAFLGLGVVGTPAFGCTFDVRGGDTAKGSARLEWSQISGAANYDVYVQTPYSGLMFAGWTAHATIDLPPATTDQRQHQYLVFARSANGQTLCVGGAGVVLDGDKKLGAITEKKIIPLAGSVRGANGSDFRTSLSISKTAFRKGRIIFRPTGTVASDADPFLRYSFGDNNDGGPEELYWDDVVAAMGASGTGSLEIIPDHVGEETSLRVPAVSARVYNVAEKGTFGSRVEAVRPAEWYLNPSSQQGSVGVFVPPAHGGARRNIGFRTLTPVIYQIKLFVPGAPVVQMTGLAPASFTQFTSLDAFVGQAVPDNARVYVSFVQGFGIAFYTETDNVTNDPSLVVGTPAQLEESVSWGYQGIPENRLVLP